jgi:DNA-binding protein YbaB
MQQAPQPMQQAPQPMQQAPQEMQQAPAPGFSGGGAVAFSRGGMSPSTDVHIDQAILRELQMAESEAEAANDPGKVAEIRAKMSGLSSRLSTPAGAMQPATSPQVPKTPQDLYDMLREPGPATKAYAEALTAQQERLKGYKPALFDDATRAKMVADEFAKNQAVSKPFYDKQSQLLEEERKAAASGDSFNSSLMRLGLGMMLPNRGNLASTFGRSGIDAMNYYDQAEQAKAAALREARKGEMGLIRSRMADERGDRTSAQTYVSEAERRALTAQTGEDTRQAGLLGLSERNKTEEERRQQANAQRIETMRRNQEREEEMRLARLDRDEQAKERAQIARERIAEMAAGRGAGRGSGDSDIRAKAKFIEDTVNEVDKKIAKLKEKETDRTTLPPERARIKADIAVLEEERKKLRTTWGALVGVSMPTSPSSAAGWSGRKQDGGS